MDVKPGDIVLFKGNSVIAKMVKFFTNSKYSHAAMIVSEKEMIEANWYKKVNIVPFEPSQSIEIYRLRGGLSASQQLSIVQESYVMLGFYYDYLQPLTYVFEKLTSKNKFNLLNFDNFVICSELIDRSYSRIGIDLVGYRSAGNVTPGDLSKSKKIERVY